MMSHTLESAIMSEKDRPAKVKAAVFKKLIATLIRREGIVFARSATCQ